MNKLPIRRPRRSTGFTVVELLVVIAIIAVLAALITPAIWLAMKKATVARMKIEVGNLAQALEQYKNEMGEYPPDFSEIGETEGQTINLKRDAINRHLANAYRYRNINALFTDGGDQLRDEDIKQLNPANALYFWLRGFYSDKQRPLTAGWDPAQGRLLPDGRSSFFEFDETRLVSPSQSAGVSPAEASPFALEYVPKGDNQLRPYVYYRAAQMEQTRSASSIGLTFPYQSALRWSQIPEANILKAPAPYGSAIAGNDFAEPRKYQLICAGLDGNYGVGGQFRVNVSASNPADVVVATAGRFPEGPYSKPDRDNITSFADRDTLEDSTP